MTEAAERFDVVVAGAGAAGLAAAGLAARLGQRTLLLEASDLIGGTSAISGGMIWCPGATAPDSTANTYLDALIPADDPQLGIRASFLRHAAEAIADLQHTGGLRLQPVPTYPDYEPTLPGATTGGRVLEPQPFDGTLLGSDFARLRPPLADFTLFGGMMVNRADLPHLRRIGRSWRSTWRAACLLATHARQRLSAPRGTTLHLGNALVAQLFLAARAAGTTIRTGQRVTAAIRNAEGGFTLTMGASPPVHACRALILTGGGFAHDPALGAALLPPEAQGLSACAPGADGSLIHLAQTLGATLQTGAKGNGLWVPVSRFTRDDGTSGLFPHTVTDRAKPGLIAVGPDAKRFTNEARSYHEFGCTMLARGLREAYLLCDRTFLWRYGLGRVKPFCLTPGRYIRSGYLASAPSLGALAAKLGLDPAALEATVATFNRHATQGEDPEFSRGSDAYQRHMGDAGHQPNPCVAPLLSASVLCRKNPPRHAWHRRRAAHRRQGPCA